MDWLAHKYMTLVSPQLRNFKKKSESLYNWSCHICGDSEKKKFRARAYLYDKDGKTLFHCHNCGASQEFSRFLKDIDHVLYQQYAIERIKDVKDSGFQAKKLKPEWTSPLLIRNDFLKDLTPISRLPPSHPARQYVVGRKIPSKYHYKLYACPNFMGWINTLLPGKFNDDILKYDSQRLLIPFINNDSVVHAVQGRALDNDEVRYITIVLNSNIPPIYGLDTLDVTKDILVVEGPLDSMFLDNGIATAGHDLALAVRTLVKHRCVIIYDNERRSKETVKKMNKAINLGYRVCIWPDSIRHKDINDMIMAGMSSEQVQTVIEQNVFDGLHAQARLNQWKKQ